MIVELIGLTAAGAAAAIGYVKSRSFVRGRLRFLDAVQKPVAPVVAGVAAAALATPCVVVLPIVGIGTALALGAAVGVGTAAGARDIRKGDG